MVRYALEETESTSVRLRQWKSILLTFEEDSVETLGLLLLYFV